MEKSRLERGGFPDRLNQEAIDSILQGINDDRLKVHDAEYFVFEIDPEHRYFIPTRFKVPVTDGRGAIDIKDFILELIAETDED
jgi:hypothetical protein